MENKFFRLKRMKAQVRQFAPVLFLILALALIGIGVSKNPILIKVRQASVDAFTPILSVLYTPVKWGKSLAQNTSEIFAVRDENNRLRAENEQLKSLETELYQLKTDNAKLAELLNYKAPGEKKFKTARVVGDTGGTFSKSVLVQVGSLDGVGKGDLALNHQGVLGRVIEVGTFASRVLLITDYTSRIPVMIGENRILGILTGDNSDLLKVISMPEQKTVVVGDRVLTSGHSGVYPSGLPVGVVVGVNGDDIYVQPFATRGQTEFVRLVNFGLTGLLPDVAVCKEK